MTVVYERWNYNDVNFDIKCEKEDYDAIEDIQKAMIRIGASLVMHREA